MAITDPVVLLGPRLRCMVRAVVGRRSSRRCGADDVQRVVALAVFELFLYSFADDHATVRRIDCEVTIVKEPMQITA